MGARAGGIDPRCRRRLYSSSEQSVQEGDEAEVPLHQWKNVREELSSVLRKELSVSRILLVC